MKYNIAVIHGDGIGPEVVQEATKVLDTIAKKISSRICLYTCIGGWLCD